MFPGDEHLLVRWVPSDKTSDRNPGSEFYVEYRPAGSDGPWERTELEEENNEANVTGLQNGEKYEVRVVAVNPHGQKTESEPKTVQVGVSAGKFKRTDIKTPRRQ